MRIKLDMVYKQLTNLEKHATLIAILAFIVLMIVYFYLHSVFQWIIIIIDRFGPLRAYY